MPSIVQVICLVVSVGFDFGLILAAIGDDNVIDAECTVKSVPLILGNILDHVGLAVPVLLSDFDHTAARPIPWSNNGVLSVKNVNHNIHERVFRQNHRACRNNQFSLAGESRRKKVVIQQRTLLKVSNRNQTDPYRKRNAQGE